MPKIGDSELLKIRRGRTYRTAIWLTRGANLVLLPLFIWNFVSISDAVPRPPRDLFTLVWTVGFVTAVFTLALLYQSGIPFNRRGLSWGPDQRMILRDVLWRRP
jgi:hypothetical protein